MRLSRRDVLRNGLRVERRGIDVHSHARPCHVDHDQPNNQRQRRHYLEVDQREHAGFADRPDTGRAGDADNHRAEDDRCDDHPDELDERVAERLHRDARARPEMTDEDAHRGGDEHLAVERFVKASSGHSGPQKIPPSHGACSPTGGARTRSLFL